MNKQPIFAQVKNNTLLDIMYEQTYLMPNQLAYIFLPDGETEDGRLTYAELDQKARAIAVMLQEYRVQPGDRVLLLYPPGPEYICGFLGCLYAGAVAVPSYPPRLNRADARLQSIAQDAQAKIALTTPEIATSIQQRLVNTPALSTVTWLTTENPGVLTLADQWKPPKLTGDTLAFLQYTSGSTSDPKGVMVSHGNLMHNEQIIQKYFEHTSESCVVTWLPPYHDMGLIGSLLQPLYVGFPAILMPPTSFLQSPVRWLRAISRYQATTSGAPNFGFDFCVQKITEEQKQGLDLSSWDVAFCGAEPIRKETLQRFAEVFEPYGFRREALFACYGLAEATLIVSGGTKGKYPHIHRFAAEGLANNQVVPVKTHDQNSHELISCGIPSPDQDIQIVDPHTLKRSSDHQVGEIWLTGPSIAQGYWNRPIETEKTFGAQLPGDQRPFLRTGDLGFIHDGEVYITGRAKDLIIIRGRNHYPQDIELTVEQSHSVLQTAGSAAFSIEVDGEEQVVVVCEVQRTARNTVNIEELASIVRQAVAEQHELQLYGFVLLKPGCLPRTSSGKVQRRACQTAFLNGTLEEAGRSLLNVNSVMSLDNHHLDYGMISAMSPEMQRPLLEKHLRQQLAKLLKVSPKAINLQQPLVAMGLDSLALVEFQTYLEVHWLTEIPFENLMGALTLEKLVSQIIDQFTTSPAQPLEHLALTNNTDSQDFPLSFDQELLWVLDQMQPGSPVYNIPIAIRLNGNLDSSILRESLDELVKRHESLRTVFLTFRGQPHQKIIDAYRIPLPTDDLSVLSQAEQDHKLAQISLDEAKIAFDLQRGPLLRVRLMRLGATSHILLLTMHHIITDLWSMSTLIRELVAIYRAKTTGKTISLPSLALRYADFAHWQRQSLQDDILAGKLAYWKQKLSGASALLSLPTDYPRPNKQSLAGGSLSFSLSPALYAQLGEISKQQGVTLYTILLTAFEALLYCYSGQSDLIIGTPVAGRPHPAMEGLIGFFAHPIILRTDLSGDPSLQELIQHIWQTTLEAYTHAVPFAKVLDVAPRRENKSYHPVYQVSFGYFTKWDEALHADGLHFELADIKKQATDFDLFLTLYNQQGGLQGVMEYSTALFAAETIQQLLDFYHRILEGIVGSLKTRLSQLTLPKALQSKVSESRSQQQNRTIALVSTFTAEPIHDMLAFWLQKMGQKAQIQFAPYGQVFQQLLNPESLLNQNTHGVNILLLRFEDWVQFETKNPLALEQNVAELILALKQTASISSTPCLVCICPASPAVYADQQWAQVYRHQEKYLVDQLADVTGVYVIPSAQIGEMYPVAQYYDAYTDREGHIPYTAVFFTALATMLTRRIYGLQTRPRKVIVLDCDQTLWKGICGEDGASGIELDAPRRLLQNFMVDQQSKGRLLCLCSKNNEPDVWDVFERRTDMPLKREHLTAWRINWKKKSENLKDLARELNLGLESFIFVDDNPVECAEVKANCPGVEILLLPPDAERIPKFLSHVWSFDQIKVTQEDRMRTAWYRQNTERERLRSDSSSLDNFLEKLELQVQISPLQPEQLDRVAQLTQRTNQFNLTTIRRTEQEILALVEAGELHCETVSVRDRFGDYGLVGLLMFSIEENAIKVDTFLLSCRAMGRNIEHRMLARLAQLAQKHGVEYIKLLYYPTAKNQPALDFLRNSDGVVETSLGDGSQFCFFERSIESKILKQSKR